MICLVLFFAFSRIECHAFSISYGSINSLEEYEEFIENYSMPLDHIHPAAFSVFGEFKHGVMHNATHMSYSYVYSSGYSVEVSHNQTKLSFAKHQIEELPVGTVSMKNTEPPADCESYYYYFRNGLYYIYDRYGSLYSLEWFAGGLYFSIDVYNHDQYSPTPIIDQLMSLSDTTADAAFTELCDLADVVPHRLHFENHNKAVTAITHAAFTICVAGIIAVCRIRAKKRRAIVTRKFNSSANGELPLTTYTNHESPFEVPNSH